MRGCALRKVVRNLAHKKLENRGVEPQHLPSQIPRSAPAGSHDRLVYNVTLQEKGHGPWATRCCNVSNNGAQPLQLFECSCLAIHGAHIPVNVFGQAHASEKFFLCFPATFTVVALRFSPPRTLLIQHLAAWPDPILSH